MRLLYINPNSTVAMTEDVVAVARKAAPEAEVIGWTNADGPPAIQGPEDGEAALPGMRALLPRARAEGVDAIVLACADDIGLAEMRAAAHCPVLGLAQSAFHIAALLGERFSVVTTLAVSVPVITANIAQYGFAGRCGGVHASGIPVLALQDADAATLGRLRDAIARAGREDGSAAVVLGCAGMAALAPDLQCSGLRLVDGVSASAHLARAVLRTTG